MSELAELLAGQRWFASKTLEISHAEIVEELPLPGGLRISFAEATFGAGTRELYQLVRDSDGDDAVDGRAGELLELIARDADVVGGDSTIRFRGIGELPIGATARPMGAEQSNSSVVFDEELALKVYRRLEPGINPELEIGRFLAERGYPHVPALRGSYEVEGAEIDATLGILQEYVADGRDGWELALDELAADPDGFVARLGELGATIGALHAALADDPSDPAFAPEEPSHEAVALLTATVDEEIERLFAELGDAIATLPIAGHGEELRDQLRSLSQIALGGRVIRTHGDLHLGQTLLAGDRWLVLDFEGEPGRPLAERRRKRSPLRDVAGMLRSFAYAASASELRRGVPAPDGWEERARAAFLGGYLGAVDETLLPHGQAATGRLLAIFELEKLIYELRYERDNRPDWVAIPVAGMLRLLGAGATP